MSKETQWPEFHNYNFKALERAPGLTPVRKTQGWAIDYRLDYRKGLHFCERQAALCCRECSSNIASGIWQYGLAICMKLKLTSGAEDSLHQGLRSSRMSNCFFEPRVMNYLASRGFLPSLLFQLRSSISSDLILISMPHPRTVPVL